MVLAGLAALTGIVGIILPVLPGLPLCFAAMVAIYFVCPDTMPMFLLVLMLGVSLVCSVLDYIAPIIITKKCGGSKWAVWGSTIGMIVGLFFMPLGLILGPLAGAFFGEYAKSNGWVHSLKIASLSFVSFVLLTGVKLISGLLMTYFVFDAIITHIKLFA